MKSLKYYWEASKVKTRERLNPYLSPIRRHFLKCERITIISNNCWGGHVYRYYGLEYMSPTIGLYFYTPDYIKFLKNLKWYLDQPLQFIEVESSRYKEDLIAHGNTHCPIGLLHDIEIVFLHYKSKAEAFEKWNRRKARINWDNIYVKMTQQNLCAEAHLKEFDNLPYVNKFVFTVNDYSIKSQVIFRDYQGEDCVRNDTVNFRKFINLTKFFNHKPFKRRQPKLIPIK